ncbi:hypothetical protein VVR12_03140 [Rothia sp. LK2588]|uniref:hypothetical protein n=1 Tax=Rothia sp. LK2588 TaxID=3114369 RepID=UPI0034CE941D
MSTAYQAAPRQRMRSQDRVYNRQKLEARKQMHLKNLKEAAKEGRPVVQKKPEGFVKRFFGLQS